MDEEADLDPRRLQSTLKINTSYSPIQHKIFYFPSGSLSSHKNSIAFTEDELDSNAENLYNQNQSKEEISQCSEYENFIAYLPQTPNTESNIKTLKRDSKLSMQITGTLNIATEVIFEIRPRNSIKLLKDEIDCLKQSLDLYKIECERYTKENKQLVFEIQQNSKELQNSSQEQMRHKSEASLLQKNLKEMEEEMIKILESVENISEDEDNTNQSKISRPHLFNHISSKLEVIRSRMYRYRTKQEKLENDIRHLNSTIKSLEEKNSMECYNRKIESDFIENQNILHDNAFEDLKNCVKDKDTYISQLESQISSLKLELEKQISGRLSLATEVSSSATNDKQGLEEETKKLGKRANSFGPGMGENLQNEQLIYQDVLKDLKEITSRATRALDHSNIMKKSNSVKSSQAQSTSPFLKKKEITLIKPLARKPNGEYIKKTETLTKQLEYERLKKKYGGISPFNSGKNK
ncbi:unnamed protein product [Blepharisma stoltei]|uniref:Uncharacterized protein n=1 Tax=Blepharisma stoltei TaxID=1481888 RepID=A0AAU9IM90_9CILI|nr:unnamed protein product [Blepharisma stoltei]